MALTIALAVLGFGTEVGQPVLRYAFFGLLGFWALMGLVFFAIYRTFPNKPSLVSIDSIQLDPGIMQTRQQLRQLGFASISRAMALNMSPQTGLIAMMDQKNKTFSIAYHPIVAPHKQGTDFVSVIQHRSHPDRVSILTTGNLAEGGTLTVPRGSFMQLFPGETPQVLFQKHLAALQFLQQHGVHVKAIKQESFRPTLFNSLKRMRATFVANPVWNTLRALVVTFTKSSGYLAPISQQASVRRQIGP